MNQVGLIRLCTFSIILENIQEGERERDGERQKYEKVKERTRSDINSFAENKGRLSIDLT